MRFQPLFGWWFILLLIIAGLAGIGWQIYQLRQVKKHKAEAKRRQIAWATRSVLLVLLALMVLGPSVPGGVTSPGVANLDVLFVVDTTASMGAEDYAGKRLRIEGVKNDMLLVAERLKGAHFGIVTFDSNVDILLPSTADYATFTGAVRTINRELFSTSNGSSIDKGVEIATKQLKNSKVAYPERSRLVFYMGDGEQTVEDPVKSFKGLAEYVEGGTVLGYGTVQGARMVKYSGLGDTKNKPSYIQTPNAATKKLVPAVSKLDEKALKKIASEVGVSYQNRNKGGSADSVIEASNAEVLIDRGKRIVHYLNLYWLVAIPFALLLLWEWKEMVRQLIVLRNSTKGTKKESRRAKS